MKSFLFSYCLDGKGGISHFSEDNTDQNTNTNQKLVWTHLDARNPQTKIWLNNQLDSIDPYIADALVAEETRPRFTQINDGMLIILRGVNPNKEDSPDDMISLRIWVEKHRIISTRLRSLKLLDEVVASLEKNMGPKNSAEFINNIITKLCNRMEPVLDDLDNKLVDIEEQVIESIDSDLREAIIDVRQQAIVFRRYILPQRDVIEQLRMSTLSWLTNSNKRYLAEIYNHVLRYIEDLDEIRERSQVVKDELSNLLSDRLNKKMYFLAVIAAIFLPLSFLTGLLGINVAGIPGANTPYAFWVFIGILLAVVVLQVYLFRKLKWL